MSKTTEAMSQAESVVRSSTCMTAGQSADVLTFAEGMTFGKLDQTEMVQACMLVADEAENLGLRDPLKDWEA